MQGIACDELHQIEDTKQNLIRSRSFGKTVTDLPSLQSAITHHIASGATKLCEQNTLAHIVGVFIYTNRFREDLLQYRGCQQLALPQGRNDSITLNHAAQKLLKTLYRSGYEYKKGGIELSGIEPQTAFRQPDLWLPESSQHNDLMQALDIINARYGRSKVRLGSELLATDWHMIRDNLSPCFTTRWAELPVVD